MLPLTQAIASILAGYESFGTTVDALAADDLDRPTRLQDWAVRDLLAHVATVQAIEADAMRRAVAGDASASGADPVPRDADLPTLVGAVRAGREALASALPDVPELDASTQVALPAGVLPLPMALTLCAVEAGLHASDLAHALDRPDALTEDQVAACVALIRPLTGLAAGSGTTPTPGTSIALVGDSFSEQWTAHGAAWAPGGGEPDATVTAGDEAIVLFVYGRIKHSDPRLEISGDRDVAARFKEFFPGP